MAHKRREKSFAFLHKKINFIFNLMYYKGLVYMIDDEMESEIRKYVVYDLDQRNNVSKNHSYKNLYNRNENALFKLNLEICVTGFKFLLFRIRKYLMILNS